MRTKLTSPKGRLIWFLNFINSKPDQLSNNELFTIWTEIREIVWGEFGSSEIPDQSLVQWDERREEAKEIRDVLRDSLERILPFSEKKNGLKPTLRRRFLRPDVGKGISGPELKGDTPFEIQRKRIPKSEEEYSPYPYQLKWGVRMVGEKPFIKFSNLQDKLLWEFVSALAQFPKTLVQRCQREDCGGYFLKGTKKEKRYCSNRCAWVMASRERWKERQFKRQSSKSFEKEGKKVLGKKDRRLFKIR